MSAYWEIGKLTSEETPRVGSICGDFFGSDHDAAGVIMPVAHQQVHALVHGNHQTANLGQLFADGSDLVPKTLDPSSESTKLAFDAADKEPLPIKGAKDGDQQEADKSQKAVEDVELSGNHHRCHTNLPGHGDYGRAAGHRPKSVGGNFFGSDHDAAGEAGLDPICTSGHVVPHLLAEAADLTLQPADGTAPAVEDAEDSNQQ